jgi:hypothetical protein
LRPPPNIHGVTGVEDQPNRRAQRLRPARGIAERGIRPVERANARAHLTAALKEIERGATGTIVGSDGLVVFRHLKEPREHRSRLWLGAFQSEEANASFFKWKRIWRVANSRHLRIAGLAGAPAGAAEAIITPRSW